MQELEMKKLWMYGAGGHASVIYDIIKTCTDFDVVGFIDDNEQRSGEVFLGYQLVTNMSEFNLINGELSVKNMFLSVGDNITRGTIAGNMKNFNFPIIVHSNAIVSTNAKIGSGTVIMPGVVVEPGAVIGEHCIINNGAIIGHYSRVGDYCHISGNAVVSGEVVVGKSSMVAIGSCITPQVKVGEHCVIGAGAVISRNIPDGARMVGNPARNMVNLKN